MVRWTWVWWARRSWFLSSSFTTVQGNKLRPSCYVLFCVYIFFLHLMNFANVCLAGTYFRWKLFKFDTSSVIPVCSLNLLHILVLRASERREATAEWTWHKGKALRQSRSPACIDPPCTSHSWTRWRQHMFICAMKSLLQTVTDKGLITLFFLVQQANLPPHSTKRWTKGTLTSDLVTV